MEKVFLDKYDRKNIIMGIVCFIIILLTTFIYKSLLSVIIGVICIGFILLYVILYTVEPHTLIINSEGIFYFGNDDIERPFPWTHLLAVIHVQDKRFNLEVNDYIIILSDSHHLMIDNLFNDYEVILEDLRQLAKYKFYEKENVSFKEININILREELHSKSTDDISVNG